MVLGKVSKSRKNSDMRTIAREVVRAIRAGNDDLSTVPTYKPFY
jgi:hypothetical protein